MGPAIASRTQPASIVLDNRKFAICGWGFVAIRYVSGEAVELPRAV